MTVYDALSPYYYFEYFRCSIVVNTIRRGAVRKYATHSDLADFIASHHRRWCVPRIQGEPERGFCHTRYVSSCHMLQMKVEIFHSGDFSFLGGSVSGHSNTPFRRTCGALHDRGHGTICYRETNWSSAYMAFWGHN